MKTKILLLILVTAVLLLSGCKQKAEEKMNIAMSAGLDNTDASAGDSVRYDLEANLEGPLPIDTKVEVYVDGQLYKSYNPSLVPGENIMSDAWGPALESQVGEHTIIFVVDPENNYTETNESDNRIERSFSVKVREEPAVNETAITAPGITPNVKPKTPLFPEDPKTAVNVILKSFLAKENTPVGDEVTATALVKIDTDKIEKFNISVNIYVNGEKNSKCTKAFTSKKLPSGDFYAAGPIPCKLIQTPFKEVGTYTLRYVLDEKNSIKENKETDNTYIKLVNVVPKEE